MAKDLLRTSEMLSEGQSTRIQKSSILEGVYRDNLTMVGRGTKRPSIRMRVVSNRKLRSVLLSAVVLLSCFSSAQSPSVCPKGTEERFVASSTIMALTKWIPFWGDSATGPVLPTYLRSPRTVDPEAVPHPIGIDEQSDSDYSLLLSRKHNVRLLSLFGLDVKTIVIDPGHGGADPGAIGALGTKEKNVTLDVAQRLKAKLNRIGNYDVLLTREGDVGVSLAERVEIATRKKVDLFISLHVNSLPDKSANIIETYYFGPPQSAETLRLARQENQDSHFAVGDFKSIIQDLGNTVKRQESADLASSIQQSLFTNVKHRNARGLDTGVKVAPFVVLSGVDAPSVLVEISCITNLKEEKKLATSVHRDEVASFLEEGIVNYLTRRSLQSVRGGGGHEQKPGG